MSGLYVQEYLRSSKKWVMICIVIDGREAFLLSADFTEAVQERNIELGLLVQSTPIAMWIKKHVSTLIQNGALVRQVLLR